ncbi:MAG: NAD(P)-dependent oxidoreductase [Nitriliruptor sp.]|uniref:NAD(P)-dependent oxidoreductase n=1 Tax=Nitriliruptor sp. TaxID=2448056 RepID=UPI0034A0A859
MIGFIGLGAMGRPMAANLAAVAPTAVWNRTATTAQQHAAEHGTHAVADLEDLGDCQVIITCLPTTDEVVQVAGRLAPVLAGGTVWIDHTSGDPAASRDLAADLVGRGIAYLDAPVSGGTDGAAAGTLTVMVGGDAEVVADVRWCLEAVGERIVHVGPLGTGHATKAVNNAMLATSLWAAAEGLAALTAAGVSASLALEVINGSSGRSFVTERLFPERVTTRTFPNTFALPLLAKDVRLAGQVLDDAQVSGEVLRLIQRLTAAAADELGPDADHTALVQVVERAADVELT